MPRTCFWPLGHGIVINSKRVIGRRVKIWHNVTVTGRRGARRGGNPRLAPETKIIIGPA